VHKLGELRAIHRNQFACAKLTSCKTTSKAALREGDRLRAPAEHFHRLRQSEFARDAGLGAVIAANDEGPDARLINALQLVSEEARRLRRGLLAVVEASTAISSASNCSARLRSMTAAKAFRLAPPMNSARAAPRQRTQRRIDVNVGGVDESERHERVER
jgi:hypothetical protein